MKNEMQIFSKEEFGEIRTVERDGKIYFGATNVAEMLGYKNPRDAISRYCRCVEKYDVPHPQSKSGKLEMNFITEGDVYRLIAHSKLPKAQEFEYWVFDEVLPTIRKTGSYSVEKAPSYQIADPIKRAEAWIEEEKKRQLLEKENLELSEVISEQKPKIEYFDTILQSPKAIPITIIAQDYGMTCQQMNHILKDIDIQYSCGGTWILKSKYQGRGYTDSETKKNDNTFIHTKWTQKGRLFLYEKLKNAGYLPMIEQ